MAANSLARLAATVRLIDHDVAGGTLPGTQVRHSAPLTGVLTQELDGAAESLRLSADEMLLATLGRTIGRTIGAGLTAVDIGGPDPVLLTCRSERELTATELLVEVRRGLAAAPGAAPEIFVYFAGAVRELPIPPWPALELRIYRCDGIVQLDWWYDIRRFYPYTVEELAEQFPLALIELCSEAVAPLICAAP